MGEKLKGNYIYIMHVQQPEHIRLAYEVSMLYKLELLWGL